MTFSGDPAILRALAGQKLDPPPVWFMRQAGRMLPEYRALRATTSDFISFCLDPEKAALATWQPVNRFDFDAAIVFADILLVPQALGQDVWFEAGKGPRLGLLPVPEALMGAVDQVAEKLRAVGETLKIVRAALQNDRVLTGFAGAPWTVLTDMIEGRSSDRSTARALAYSDPQKVDRYLNVLVEATARYLAMQARAGAQVLQIFKSWAEGLSEPLLERLVIGPHQELLRRLGELGISVPVIGFPRGAGSLLDRYAEEVPVQGVGLDTQTSAAQGVRIQVRRSIQRALDPLLLRARGPRLLHRVDQLLAAWGKGPYIFNLGHRILPETPIGNVQAVLDHLSKARTSE